MVDRIEGFVAQVLTERSLAINRGSSHGVSVGMRFAVLNPNGIAITDPETGEALDSVELAKTIVKVVDVKPRVCVAQTFRTVTTKAGPMYTTIGSMSDLMRPPSERIETLRSSESYAEREISEEDSLVKVGDPVVEVTRGEDFEGRVISAT